MPPSSVEILLPNRPTEGPRLIAVADREHPNLLLAFAGVPDPRDARGRRYSPVSMCAVLAGVCTLAAITDWIHDLDRPARQRLRFTRRFPVSHNGMATADPPRHRRAIGGAWAGGHHRSR